ncbi:erythromycin esterase [Chitinophaga jiangningensis]|uniref:Erythromycin esterase n=1 Tax=Chitinophaga jiangningensis TaxID=1419482 RepID=A0A1M7HEU6_9BACT|nr:erythromycin esterase family protein [Chitinophaga jiangningensis]SHM27022.1 erythromycin esterase [Chitinophaga jiangningensis]
MKKVIIAVCCLVPFLPTKAQQALETYVHKHAAAIASTDPANTDYTDLYALKQAIGNSRIVMLGEQTHGEGSTFLAKTRIIQYLHEQLGFEVLAFESGFYDVNKIWGNVQAGASLKEQAPNNLFYMYATSEQMYPLFNYVQQQLKSANPITVTGFESQHSGAKAINEMMPDMTQFLFDHYPGELDSDWKVFKAICPTLFKTRNYKPDTDSMTIFFRKTHLLKLTLASNNASSDPQSLLNKAGFWYRAVCSIESQAIRYWGLAKGNEINYRDLQMADNLIWLADTVYPGKKIIVWAHNGHIANTMGNSEGKGGLQDFYNTFIPMGAKLKKHFGNNVYALGFSGSEGKYMDYVSLKIMDVPPPQAGSIEAALAATNKPAALLDYRHAGKVLQQNQVACIGDFMAATAVWPRIFDGLFFIRTSTPVIR